MAKRKLTIGGGFVAICEESQFNDDDHKNYTSLFHPRLGKLSECAGYAPYWLCDEYNIYEKVKEYKV